MIWMRCRSSPLDGEVTRRQVRLALGLLWLSAAGLQAQPLLFTRGFARDLVAPNALFQPAVVADPVRLASRVILTHPVMWNLTFVLAELTLGLCLLTTRSTRLTRAACVGSALWGASVWWIGEGAGGLFTGHASLATGAPGAALLYALLSVASLPRTDTGPRGRARTRRQLSWSWGMVWSLGGLLVLIPGQGTALALADQLGMGAMMSPAVLARPERNLAGLVSGHHQLGAIAAVSLALICVLVGLTPSLWPARRRLALRCGIALAAVFWVAAQGFGGVSTGQATDLGAAPVLMLLGYTLLRACPAARAAPFPVTSGGHLLVLAR
jgi:hypothetical protein